VIGRSKEKRRIYDRENVVMWVEKWIHEKVKSKSGWKSGVSVFSKYGFVFVMSHDIDLLQIKVHGW
jgi:hypothetical protein